MAHKGARLQKENLFCPKTVSDLVRSVKNRRAGGGTSRFPFGHWPNPGFNNCRRSQGACALLPSRVSCKRISANCVETCHCSARCILRMNFWLRILQALDLVNVHALDISSCRQGSLRMIWTFQCLIRLRYLNGHLKKKAKSWPAVSYRATEACPVHAFKAHGLTG